MMHDIYHLLPDRLDTGIIVLDRSQQILLWNTWLEKYTGKKKSEVAGQTLPQLYPLFQRELYQSFFRHALEQGKSMFCSGSFHPLFIPPFKGEPLCRQNMQIEYLEAGSEPHILLQIFDVTNQHKRVQLLKQEIARRTDAEKALHNQLDKARHIHERTLPQSLPDVQGLTFAAHYQPAQKLGGDFYNVIKAGQKIVLYLSDVSGHGLDGALLTVFAKEAIDSYIALKPEQIEPASILSHLDRQFRNENYPPDYFICIFLAVFDLGTNELTYTGVGFQTLPLLKLEKGGQHQLYSGGPPISVVISPELMDFEEKKLRLEPGDTLMFSTDGLVEQEVEGETYQERAEIIFYANSYLPPATIVQALNEDFRRFNRGSIEGDDDITFLVMKVEK